MKTTCGLICAVFCLFLAVPQSKAGSICDAVSGNLVANCGFETGDFTGWILSGNDVPAELGNLYRREYFLFSKRTHATTSGLISMESGISRGHVLKTVVYILIATAANLVQAVPTDTPQKHVDRASELIAILTDMVSRGAFEDLNPSDDSLPA